MAGEITLQVGLRDQQARACPKQRSDDPGVLGAHCTGPSSPRRYPPTTLVGATSGVLSPTPTISPTRHTEDDKWSADDRKTTCPTRIRIKTFYLDTAGGFFILNKNPTPTYLPHWQKNRSGIHYKLFLAATGGATTIQTFITTTVANCNMSTSWTRWRVTHHSSQHLVCPRCSDHFSLLFYFG